MFLNKASSRRYPAETITDADFADDLAIFITTPAPAESLKHNLEHSARGIGFYVSSFVLKNIMSSSH